MKLSSWKAIAAYMGRDVRTVQRWEAAEGLPVHRLEHSKRGSVYAFADELDAWTAARSVGPVAPAPAPVGSAAVGAGEAGDAGAPAPAVAAAGKKWGRGVLAAALVLALMAGVWVWVWPHRTAPRQVEVQRMTLPAVPVPRRWFGAATAEAASWKVAAAGLRPRQIVLAGRGEELYVSGDSAAVMVLDAASLATRAVIPLAFAPQVLVATPQGDQVYAANPEHAGLERITVADRRVTWIGLDAGASDLAFAPGGRSLYLAERFDGLARLDLTTMTVAHIASVECPAALAMAPDGNTLYVGYQCGGPEGRRGHDSIGVFDIGSGRFRATWGGDLPMVASVLAVTPDGSQLWASAGDACTAATYDHRGCPPGGGNFVYIYDTRSGRLLGRPAIPSEPNHIMFFPDTARALLDAALVDGTRQQVLETTVEDAGGAVMSGDGRHLYLALVGRNAVAKLDNGEGECAPPVVGLTAWWPGDGSTADVAGILAGRAAAGVAYALGKRGQAFRLAGPDTAIDFGHDVALGRDWNEGMSVAAWIKADALRSGNILHKGSWQLAVDGRGGLTACFGTGACLKSPGPLTAGAWYHVALSSGHDHQAHLYLDGKDVAQGRLPQRTSEPNADLIAGGAFRGLLDEIEVYARPLTEADLRSLMSPCH